MLGKHNVKIGDKLRFIDDRDLYTDIDFIKLPELGKIYEVRGYSFRGFYLVEITNPIVRWLNADGTTNSREEPGFGAWRFEKAQPVFEGKKIEWKLNQLQKMQPNPAKEIPQV